MVGKKEFLSGRRLLVPCCALLVGLLAAAECFAQEHEPTATVIVRMTDALRFKPAQVVVHVGDTVQWQNTSTMAHTVTADKGRAPEDTEVALPPGAAPFDSGSIAPGGFYDTPSLCSVRAGAGDAEAGQLMEDHHGDQARRDPVGLSKNRP